MRLWIRRVILLMVGVYLVAWACRITPRRYYLWLPGYVSWRFHQERPVAAPIHVFFFFTDHFEPGGNSAMVDRWVKEYPKVADRHRDSDGRPWQHDWFYPGEQPVDYNMLALQKLVVAGYGAVELHLHHSYDTPQSARTRFQRSISWFQTFGFLKSEDGATHFAFIHGDWGLDNSRGRAYCGNSRELAMLRELGCFADYTFSSIFTEAQPSSVNSIYYATDDDGPKSYDTGMPVRVGLRPSGDLMIFQGPLLLVPALRPAKLFFEVENAEIHAAAPVTPARVDAWIRSNIHVHGRPEWRFVKIHAHGATTPEDTDEILGPEMDHALSYLERVYNDGSHYVLHYVTAREAFNLVRAAVDGKTGNPRLYYDYLIPPYVANRPARTSSPEFDKTPPQAGS